MAESIAQLVDKIDNSFRRLLFAMINKVIEAVLGMHREAEIPIMKMALDDSLGYCSLCFIDQGRFEKVRQPLRPEPLCRSDVIRCDEYGSGKP